MLSVPFMSLHLNSLGFHRKLSPLTQSDIAILLDLPDHSVICRYEKGSRPPSIETLLVYHLIFDVTIESLLKIQREAVRAEIIYLVQLLLRNLKARDKIPKIRRRITFLEEALTRLNHTTAYEEK